jgi:hypothetical protein
MLGAHLLRIKTCAVRSAHSEPGSVSQDHEVIPFAAAADLGDSRSVHDRGPMDAGKLTRVKAPLHGGHGVAQQVAASFHVHPDVIAVSTEPIDVSLIEQQHATAVPKDDSRRTRIGERTGQRRRAGCGGRVGEPPASPLDRQPEAFPVDGLQKVVDRVDVERTHGVSVVRGYEDRERHFVDADRLDDRKTVHFGHLNVEQNEVRGEFVDGGDRGTSGIALSDDLHVWQLVEPRPQATTRKRLVIHDPAKLEAPEEAIASSHTRNMTRAARPRPTVCRTEPTIDRIVIAAGHRVPYDVMDHPDEAHMRYASSVRGAFAALLLIATGMGAQTRNAGDVEAVRRAALDYVEGFYEGDTVKLVRALRPEMYKYGFWRDSDTSAYRGSQMTYAQAMAYANRVKAQNRPTPASAPKDVRVLDVMDQTASAKLTAQWGFDYLLLAKFDGRWMITHVLWQGPNPASGASR